MNKVKVKNETEYDITLKAGDIIKLGNHYFIMATVSQYNNRLINLATGHHFDSINWFDEKLSVLKRTYKRYHPTYMGSREITIK